MARVSLYLGSPPPGRLHQALLMHDGSVLNDALPVSLDDLIACGMFGPTCLDEALHEWTLFPYYAHYVGPVRAGEAARAMAGRGRWPHEVLGSWSPTVPPPDRLRFCLECREDMLEVHPDLWWRLSHQLPSVVVCPDHGAPLHLSPVTQALRKSAYIAATPEICLTASPPVLLPQDRRVRHDLLIIARASEALLDRDVDKHPDDRRMRYLESLDRLDLLNSEGAANLSGVARAMDGYWGTTLDVWPGLRTDGRCGQRWLGGLLLSGRDSPPLHHLLLELMSAGRLGR